MFDIKKIQKNKISPEKIKTKKRIYTSLIPADEKEYFVENLSMLLSSGMDIVMALESIKREVRSPQMIRAIIDLQEDVEAGAPIWKALEDSHLFPSFIISLIKIGEKSGGLVKNLKVISIQQKKDRSFTSKIRSAMMYPVFVLGLTVVVGISIAWFILPKLVLVFEQLKVDLPLVTRVLMSFGKFIASYGNIAIPIFLFLLFFIIFFVFIFSKTKFIGQTLLFYFPGIRRLILETELARMGYILGTLLKAGLPIVDALKSLAEASTFYKYKKMYLFFIESITDGNSFQQSFELYRKSQKLIPFTVQQMIVVGEKSGRLSETLLSIGETFEEKIDNTTKNIASILEPILLVIVWLGVVAVALAVILPIYSLIGGLNKETAPSKAPLIVTETVTEQIVTDNNSPQLIVDSNAQLEKKLEIIKTPTGTLNVRNMGSSQGKIIAKVLAGETYVYTNIQAGWYEIILKDGIIGWVSESYVKVLSDSQNVGN
jgi:type IV pilus assembly protein PilC